MRYWTTQHAPALIDAFCTLYRSWRFPNPEQVGTVPVQATDRWPRLGAWAYSLQAVRSLFEFALPALSPSR
jgi:hypothetical protein